MAAQTVEPAGPETPTAALQRRVQELETQNQSLQLLVAEQLEKNQQLRLEAAQPEEAVFAWIL
jgi:hypothetical protein